MSNTRVNLECPFCGTTNDCWFAPALAHKEKCSDCGETFCVTVEIKAVPLSTEEVHILSCMQGMGYEIGFSPHEQQIVEVMTKKGYVKPDDEGNLDKTPLGEEIMRMQGW